MKKKLIVTPPLITSYPAIANVFSILGEHRDKVLPWISNYFIQLIVRPNYSFTQVDFYDHADLNNHYCILWGCPYLNWMRNNIYTANFDKFTDYIEYQINQGFYLEANLDNYYFRISEFYNKNHFIHPTFIYGYNNETKEVNISDFYNGKGYSRQIEDYDSINNSMANDYIINLYKYQDAEYTFNHELMNTYFEDYLYSRDSMKKYSFSYQKYNHDVIYGLECYDYIISNLSENEVWDIRPFHVLYDHKKLMCIRLEYLKNCNEYDYNKINESILISNKIFKKTEILRNMVVKYNLNKDIHLFDRIKEMCEKVKELDRKLFESVLCSTKR